MRDEAAAVAAAAAIGTTVTLTPLVKISYGVGNKYGVEELTSVEAIDEINECVLDIKQINLYLFFNDYDENFELLYNTIVETSRHIKNISMFNACDDKEEHRRCFTYCTKIVQGIIGNGKHLTYHSNHFDFELEQANQLAEAIVQSSNNNNNDAIDSFNFRISNLTPVTFQLLWNALLDSGVRKIKFCTGNSNRYSSRYSNRYSNNDGDTKYNNINIDFTGMKTNTSLKELNLSEYHMREEDYRNLFHSMKVNKGLVGLHFFYTTYKDLSEEMKRLFQEMLCENSTLLDCRLYGHGNHGNEEDKIYEMIQFQMELNRMWKRYVMKRENEKKTPAVRTRIEEGDNNNEDEVEEEEERKKRLKMKLLLHLFMKKPVMRSTILFHLLREYPNDLVSNNTNNEHQQQNPLLLRIMSSNVAKNKKKRTTDGDDPNDNDGVINLCDSESDDGTDGPL